MKTTLQIIALPLIFILMIPVMVYALLTNLNGVDGHG